MKTKKDIVIEWEKSYQRQLAQQEAINALFSESERHEIYGFPVCTKCGAVIENTWSSKKLHHEWHGNR